MEKMYNIIQIHLSWISDDTYVQTARQKNLNSDTYFITDFSFL